MSRAKNAITLILIILSVVLLLVLQIFWLRKVYRDEEESFYNQTGLLFRNTIFTMSDSLLAKSIKPLPFNKNRILISDSLKFRTSSTLRITREKDTTANVQVFISSGAGKDSLDRFLMPLAKRLKEMHGEKIFSIRLATDSLEVSDIDKKFRATLKKADIYHPFIVQNLGAPNFIKSGGDQQHQNYIRTPAGNYTVVFPDLNFFLIKKIAPQILFSVFLTLLTAASFIILYRNIRFQQKLMELKNDFISNMTHELKTPLTTVSVALEALKNFNGLDNPKLTEEYLEIAQNELNRLTLLTDKILKTGVFENSEVELESEPVEVDKLITQVLSSMKLVFDKNKAEVSFTKDGTDFRLLGSTVHLTGVIYNLLDNALKYSNGPSQIAITLSEEPEQVNLTVKDNGIGIPKEYAGRIFEKFFRVPSGNIHNVKGYGLGLSYAYSVIKAHKGKIDVESEPGNGSTFIIRLPKIK